MKIYRAIFHYNNADTCEWKIGIIKQAYGIIQEN